MVSEVPARRPRRAQSMTVANSHVPHGTITKNQGRSRRFAVAHDFRLEPYNYLRPSALD